MILLYLAAPFIYSPKLFLFSILYTLQNIHDQKYVHGDIRRSNLVFNKNGVDTWIIDFDMAAKNGRYCKGYATIHIIKERHPGAFQGRYNMTVIHLHI